MELTEQGYIVKNIAFYEISTRKAKSRSKRGSDFTNTFLCSMTLQTHTMNDYEELEYKPTDTLLDYLDVVDFGKKRKKGLTKVE